MPDEGGGEFMTVRDILMEVREDVRDIKDKLPSYVTWRQMWAAFATVAGLAITIITTAT